MLLPGPALPVFGDVHALRLELMDLSFLLGTYSGWGVRSALSGPFGDGEFGRCMACLDRCLRFLYHDGSPAAAAEAAAALPRPQDGAFVQRGGGPAGDEGYRCEGLWSVDVAAAWALGGTGTGGTGGAGLLPDGRGPVAAHQVRPAAAGREETVGRNRSSGPICGWAHRCWVSRWLPPPWRAPGRWKVILRSCGLHDTLLGFALGSGRMDPDIAYR